MMIDPRCAPITPSMCPKVAIFPVCCAACSSIPPHPLIACKQPAQHIGVVLARDMSVKALLFADGSRDMQMQGGINIWALPADTSLPAKAYSDPLKGLHVPLKESWLVLEAAPLEGDAALAAQTEGNSQLRAAQPLSMSLLMLDMGQMPVLHKAYPGYTRWVQLEMAASCINYYHAPLLQIWDFLFAGMVSPLLTATEQLYGDESSIMQVTTYHSLAVFESSTSHLISMHSHDEQCLSLTPPLLLTPVTPASEPLQWQVCLRDLQVQLPVGCPGAWCLPTCQRMDTLVGSLALRFSALHCHNLLYDSALDEGLEHYILSLHEGRLLMQATEDGASQLQTSTMLLVQCPVLQPSSHHQCCLLLPVPCSHPPPPSGQVSLNARGKSEMCRHRL